MNVYKHSFLREHLEPPLDPTVSYQLIFVGLEAGDRENAFVITPVRHDEAENQSTFTGVEICSVN